MLKPIEILVVWLAICSVLASFGSSSMATHSWETPLLGAHSWEHNLGGEDGLDDFWDASDDDFANDLPESPAQTLISILVDHYLYSRLSAQQVCTMMFWMEQCGIQEAGPFSLKPGSSSGHYSRKMKAALGHIDSDDLYEADVPGH